MSRSCVANAPALGGNFENSELFFAIFALNQEILSPEKFKPDSIRGS